MGEQARNLVDKWKFMVKGEEEKEQNEHTLIKVEKDAGKKYALCFLFNASNINCGSVSKKQLLAHLQTFIVVVIQIFATKCGLSIKMN